MKQRLILGIVLCLLLVTGLMPGAIPTLAASPSTSVTVTKYASDNSTVLAQATKDYAWLEANLPVYGDGVTHYYHQGPTFDPADMWNTSENVNVDSRDYGAAKGTDIKDLLALVGGAPAGSEIEVKATDNFSKRLAADDVNDLDPDELSIILAWNNATLGGYVPAYATGMRLIFFDEDDTAKHVFGNWDMHETLDAAYWHYNYSGGTLWPSSSGLSVQNVDRINIYTDEAPPTLVDVLCDGPVDLTPGGTFNITAYNSSVSYTVNQTTPLGALNAAATSAVFTYGVTDKNYAGYGTLLLDNVGTYLRDKPNKIYWYAYVNDVYKDGFNNNPDGLNVIQLADGDKVEFYYAANIADPSDLTSVQAAATAAVKTVASITSPVDILYNGTVDLTPGGTFNVTAYNSSVSYTVNQTTPLGALNATATSAVFTYGVTDKNYAGYGTLLLDNVGTYLRDKPNKIYWYAYVNDVYKDGFNNNPDGLNVIQLADGDKVEFYYAANIADPSDLTAVKAAATAAVKTVASTGVAPTDWTLQLSGARDESVTKAYFEDGLACPSSGHQVFWTDGDSNVWGGVPLWLLVGMVDDNPDVGPLHFNFNDALAAQNYKVKVIASDGWSTTLDSSAIARNDGYIVANTLNGDPLPPLTTGGKPCWPLYLKGAAAFGGQQVGGLVRIELTDMPAPPAGWTLELLGEVGDTITQAEFEDALACASSGHYREWTDINGDVWSGVPLWVLVGAVDDVETGAHWTFNDTVAATGYSVNVTASDNFSRSFTSAQVARSDNYIIANKFNGLPLVDRAPLRLVGPGVTRPDGTLGGSSVGSIAEIELADFLPVQAIPQLHIIKYDTDRTTVLTETTVDYLWMQDNLAVIGDGTTVYRFEGITNAPADLWDAAETYPGGYKIENAVKGSRIKDLCELVGGMGSGTEITLIASDGYETILPYSSIYTNPAVQARQGDAILTWFADGKYVPYYQDGMRVFFTPDGDHVYGQWDMHETLTEPYWHYWYDSVAHIMYPSCAGLSGKWITSIKVYSVPETDWTLELDGRDIGGLRYDVSKTYFEQALACQMGANHAATYTDSQSCLWEGISLWFLAGFVDDADQHSNNAFNDALAQAGYRVVITASDGYSVTIASQDIIRNSNYIVANSLNGTHIPDADSNWPLRLVGAAVSGGQSISGIVRIELLKLVPAATGSSGSGGGGGGGGGSSGYTSLADYITGEGKFAIDATIKSIDGNVKLDIPKGTVATNKNGQRLNSIFIKEQAPPAGPPDDCDFMCVTYDIGPGGAKFEPAIWMTLKYDESELRAGASEEKLVVATWVEGAWVELEGSDVDPENNTIRVPVSHLSIYTTMVHTSPASFEVAGLTVNPSEVSPEAPVQVNITVTNTGDLTGNYTLSLKVNNADSQSKDVTLKGGESQTVSFTVTSGTGGGYTVNVNGLLARYKVTEPTSEGTVAEIPATKPPAVPTTPSPAVTEKPAAPVQTTQQPEAPAQETSPSGSNGLLITVSIIGAFIVIGLVTYFVMRRRGAQGHARGD